ncbi:MAG: tetratricopeptide repeat protein [Bacteroidaceae bacterium]|nr:tetratricopeptide repeat protein [Bacteroidaceae bacterium]
MAQKEVRRFNRMGNTNYKDSSFVAAETNYRRALNLNGSSTVAAYNLGKVLNAQGKKEDALKQYDDAIRIMDDNKEAKAYAYHNKGVLLYKDKKYGPAVEAYKQSLINNPTDNETRYNLALAQKMLRLQQQQQKKQEQKKDKKEDKKKDKKEQKKKNDQKQQQKNAANKKNKMSKENAQQLLNAAMQDEKKTQEKMKKMQPYKGGKLEKNW